MDISRGSPIVPVVGPGQACPQCRGVLLLSGTDEKGRMIALCEECDVNDEAAKPLITFFQVHQRVDGDNLEEFADLLRLWAATVQPRTVDLAALEAEYEAWRRGEL